MKVLVLGAGLVGSPMAKDLAKNNEFDVTVADVNTNALELLKSRASKQSKNHLMIHKS